ncbi:MAG TPA: putative DNA-binding domain-containing protein [Candidatus Binataceae bacterium]
MTIPLREIERLLYRLITAPSGVAEGLAREQGLSPGDLGTVIRGDARLSAVERVDIYADAYFYRLLDAAKEDFPATLKVFGESGFHNLLTGYLIDYPPTEPSIFYAHRFLADFVRSHPIRGKAPYVADLAALERALVEVFHAAEAPALDAAAMRAIAPAKWPALRMRTHPAVMILSLQWRVADVLRAVEQGRDFEPVVHEPVEVLVWRRNSRVYYREIEATEARALAVAVGGGARGATFAKICAAIAAGCDGAEHDAVGAINRMLERWLGDGLLMLVRRAKRRN